MSEHIDLVVGALDSLGVALADHGHEWTEGERAIYEESVQILWNMSNEWKQLQKQLAAEREKVKLLVDALEQIDLAPLSFGDDAINQIQIIARYALAKK